MSVELIKCSALVDPRGVGRLARPQLPVTFGLIDRRDNPAKLVSANTWDDRAKCLCQIQVGEGAPPRITFHKLPHSKLMGVATRERRLDLICVARIGVCAQERSESNASPAPTKLAEVQTGSTQGSQQTRRVGDAARHDSLSARSTPADAKSSEDSGMSW